MIHPAPAGHVFIGHGHKIHLCRVQLSAAAVAQKCLLGKPEHILETEIRLHVFVEHLDKLIDLRNVFQAHQLFDHGFQQSLLGLDAAQIAVGIAQHLAVFAVVMAVTEYLHGVVAAEKPVALGLVDGEVLNRVLIVHVAGDVKIHAAHGVHDLAHGFPLHNHLIVRLEAHQLRDFFIEGLDALFSAAVIIINGIDPLDVPRNVDHGIPRNGHDGGLLVGDIIAGQQHGVRVAAAARVPTKDQHRIIILALALAADPRLHAVSVVDAVFCLRAVGLGTARQLRLDEHGFPRHNGQQHRRQHDRRCQQPFLLLCQAAGLLCLFGFFLLQTLSNILCHGSISFLSASHALQ